MCQNIHYGEWSHRTSKRHWVSKMFLLQHLSANLFYPIWQASNQYLMPLSLPHSYGLGAAVISKDLERCERFTKVRLSYVAISSWGPLTHILHVSRETFVFGLCFAGCAVRDCVDKLLTALLQWSPLGRQQAQRNWAWTWRMVRHIQSFQSKGFPYLDGCI